MCLSGGGLKLPSTGYWSEIDKLARGLSLRESKWRNQEGGKLAHSLSLVVATPAMNESC